MNCLFFSALLGHMVKRTINEWLFINKNTVIRDPIKAEKKRLKKLESVKDRCENWDVTTLLKQRLLKLKLILWNFDDEGNDRNPIELYWYLHNCLVKSV